MSGKKLADIFEYWYEATHSSVTGNASQQLLDLVDRGDPVVASLFKIYESEGLTRNAISYYEEEIAGRVSSRYDRSADEIYFICGWCYEAIFDLEKAEETFKEGLSRVCTRKRLRKFPFISDMWYGSNDKFGYDVALILTSQRRIEEAIATIENHSRSVMRSPNGKETWLHFFHGGNRCIGSRTLLAELLIYQGRLDDCLKLNVLSDARDLLKINQKPDRDVSKILAIVSALVYALFKEKRMTTATEMQRALLGLMEEIFRPHDSKTLETRYVLAVLLSHQSSSEVNEAINLLSEMNNRSALVKNKFIMGTRYAQAFALGRQNRLFEALDIMRQVRDTIKTTWGPYHPETMGCMRHLAPSLGTFHEDDISKACSLQEDILDMCAQENHVGIQQNILFLLFTLSIPEAIKEALQRMRELIKLMESLHVDTGRSYVVILSSFVFILSAEGFLFEQHAMLTEASDACIALLRTAEQLYGSSSFEYLEAKNLFASVLTKRTMLLYYHRGFGADDIDLMNYAVTVHRGLLDLSVKLLGNEHEKTLTARIDCASSLVEHGITISSDSEQAEAESLLHYACEARRNLLGPDHLSTLWAETQMAITHYRFGRMCSADAEQQQHLYITELSRHKVINRPFRALQTAKLVSMLLKSGNHGPKALSSAKSLYTYYKESWGKTHPMTIRALQTLGLLEHKHGQAVDLAKFRCVFWRAKQLSADLPEQFRELESKHKLIGVFDLEGLNDQKALKMQEELLDLALGVLGKQHTRTISIMIQLSQMLSKRNQKTKAFTVLAEAISISTSLVGTQHHLTVVCWSWIQILTNLGEPVRSKTATLIDQNVVTPLNIKGNGNPPEELINLKDEIRLRAQDFSLAFHILGESHQFTSQMRQFFSQALAKVPRINPGDIQDIVGRAVSCTELPDATRSFLQ